MPNPPPDLSIKIRQAAEKIVSAARLPSGQVRVFKRAELEEWERAIQMLVTDIDLLEHDFALRRADLEARVADLGQRPGLPAPEAPTPDLVEAAVSAPELEHLRLTLEARERHLAEAEEELRRREQFLLESEELLFRKLQLQQEQETSIDMRREAVEARERDLGLREAPVPEPIERA